VDRQFPTQRLDQGGENIVINGNSHACELTRPSSRSCSRIALNTHRRRRRSQRKLRLRSLLLRAAARDFPTLAADLELLAQARCI
jgi:hypothetical protein